MTGIAAIAGIGLSMSSVSGATAAPFASADLSAAVDFYDPSTSHTIAVTVDEAAYNEAMNAWFSTQKKKWFSATVTIDGVTLTNVGLKLKGNSTLQSIVDDRDGNTDTGSSAGIGTAATMYASQPETLPYEIRTDKYIDGQTYQGRTEFAVRPAGSTYTSGLNEALALSLTAQSSQATQRYNYVTYSVNGRTASRIVVENPDEAYADELFESDGVLYKVDSTSTFSYLGDDLSAYSEQYDQINHLNDQTVAPVVEFLKWLDSADDAEFAAHLADWVDIDSLAAYLATQDLFQNMDTLNGPGRNGYLWYDLSTKKITVVSWDLNLAYSTLGGMPDGELPDGFPKGGLPEGFPGGELPEGVTPGEMTGTNSMITRFQANTAFAAMEASEKERLSADWYDDGTALALLDEIAATIPTVGTMTADTVEKDRVALAAVLATANGSGGDDTETTPGTGTGTGTGETEPAPPADDAATGAMPDDASTQTSDEATTATTGEASDSLASTGAEMIGAVAAGALLLVLGAAAIGLGRRRESARTEA
jgi:LPXTG-motif cell wall-anchored protein